jgi:hypothetical protein
MKRGGKSGGRERGGGGAGVEAEGGGWHGAAARVGHLHGAGDRCPGGEAAVRVADVVHARVGARAPPTEGRAAAVEPYNPSPTVIPML